MFDHKPYLRFSRAQWNVRKTLTSTHFIKSLHQSSDKDTCECPVQGCSNIDKEELQIHIAIPLTRCKDISKNRAIFVANCCEATKEGTFIGVEARLVPVFCAICLMQYNVHEKLCWSSNKECAHVFHRDCILKWFVSLECDKSRDHSIPDSLNQMLPKYQLECPCCRQEFVSWS